MTGTTKEQKHTPILMPKQTPSEGPEELSLAGDNSATTPEPAVNTTSVRTLSVFNRQTSASQPNSTPAATTALGLITSF